MSKRRVVWIVIFMLGVSLGAYWFWQTKTPLMTEVVTHEMMLGGNAFQYPQLKGLPNANAQKALNEIIQQEMNRFAASLTIPETQAQSEYSVHLNQGDIVSLSMTEFYYVKHSAHPMTYLRSFTFQTRTGKIISFQELFRADSNYAAVINQVIKKNLEDRQIVMLRPFQSVTEKQEYYLTAEGLVVYYQLYEYTPYVQGFLKVAIPYRQLEGILVPEILQAVTGTRH